MHQIANMDIGNMGNAFLPKLQLAWGPPRREKTFFSVLADGERRDCKVFLLQRSSEPSRDRHQPHFFTFSTCCGEWDTQGFFLGIFGGRA